jgi:hypothetical protein
VKLLPHTTNRDCMFPCTFTLAKTLLLFSYLVISHGIQHFLKRAPQHTLRRVDDIHNCTHTHTHTHTHPVSQQTPHKAHSGENSQAGFKLAPPTKNPSTSGCCASSLAFLSVTLPPYKILVSSAAFSDTFSLSQARMAAWTSWACAVVATFPVPMAHTGSYAITILLQSLTSSATAASCEVTTSMVTPASRCYHPPGPAISANARPGPALSIRRRRGTNLQALANAQNDAQALRECGLGL